MEILRTKKAFKFNDLEALIFVCGLEGTSFEPFCERFNKISRFFNKV